MNPWKIIPAFMIASAITMGATSPEPHIGIVFFRLIGNLFWVLWLIWPDKKDSEK